MSLAADAVLHYGFRRDSAYIRLLQRYATDDLGVMGMFGPYDVTGFLRFHLRTDEFTGPEIMFNERHANTVMLIIRKSGMRVQGLDTKKIMEVKKALDLSGVKMDRYSLIKLINLMAEDWFKDDVEHDVNHYLNGFIEEECLQHEPHSLHFPFVNDSDRAAFDLWMAGRRLKLLKMCLSEREKISKVSWYNFLSEEMRRTFWRESNDFHKRLSRPYRVSANERVTADYKARINLIDLTQKGSVEEIDLYEDIGTRLLDIDDE